MQKPQVGEYKPYFQRYLDLLGQGDFDHLLSENTKYCLDFFKQIPAEKHSYRYAPEKWDIKQVFLHIIDTERVFAYRALVCLRGDNKTPLHYMDEDLYVANANTDILNMDNLIRQFEVVRSNTQFLFENITESQSKFVGNVDSHPTTARALGYILIGHVIHHLQIIKERYL